MSLENIRQLKNEPIRSQGRKHIARRSLVIIFGSLFLVVVILLPWLPGRAAASLQISSAPLTWNVVGLDSANVNTGPNQYPSGIRVCNTGDTAANNVVAAFNWDSANPNINLSSPISQTLSTLPGFSTCTDFYFYIRITRTPSVYNTARRFHITISATGLTPVSSPSPREIYVEHLLASPNLAISNTSGPNNVNVGGSYQYVVRGAVNAAYGELETFLSLSSANVHLQRASTYFNSFPAKSSQSGIARISSPQDTLF